MIRPDLMKTVVGALGTHKFLAVEDFLIEEGRVPSGKDHLTLTYRYVPQYWFRLVVPSVRSSSGAKEGYVFECVMRPGTESESETVSALNRTGLTSEIQEWLIRLHADVASAPVLRQIREQSEQIKAIREQLESVPDEEFSSQDISKVFEALEELRAETAAAIKRENTDKVAMSVKIKNLEDEIEFLKQAVTSMSKPRWFELLQARVSSWTAKLGLRELSAVTRVAKLLGVGGEEVADLADAMDAVAEVAEGPQTPK